MKKILLLTAAILILLLCMKIPGDIPGGTSEEPEDEERPTDTILVYSEWTDEEGRKLSFNENSTGSLGGESFRWENTGDELRLNYMPGTESSENYIIEISYTEGRPVLKLGENVFCQRCEFIKEPETDPLLELGQQIADMAAGFEGCKYVYGGKSPETGFDCSGLVYYVYDNFGYRVQRVAADQAKQGVHVEPDELQPGDILCFYTSGKYIGHVGIYIGDGYYIHAMGRAYGVVKTAVDDPATDPFEARRLVGSPELLKENQGNAA